MTQREVIAAWQGAAMKGTTMNWQGAIVKKSCFKSNAKTLGLAAFVAIAASGYASAADLPLKAPPPPKAVPFFFVNDTSISGTWFFNATDPGISGSADRVPGGVAGTGMTTYRAQGAVDHFDVWEYGTNLIHLELDQYGKNDPIQGQPGASGSREFFGFTRSTLGFNELTHTKLFSTPFTNDVGFEFGFTGGTQNNYLTEETTQYVVGVNFDLAIPKPLGLMLFSVMAYKEFTHNEFDACGPGGAFSGTGAPGFFGACVGGGAFGGNRDFEWTWRLEAFNSVPLGGLLGSWADAAHIINILNVTGPKGTGLSTANCAAIGCAGTIGVGDAFGINETKTEVFEDVRLSLDTSKIFWGKPGIWDSYVGYRYWFNKFGTNHNDWLFATNAPGTSIESTAYVGATYHFK